MLRAADLALSDAIRAQNGPFVVQRALRNREHGAAVWAFVRDNWDRVTARFSPSLIPRVIEGTTWLVDDAVAERRHRVRRRAPVAVRWPHHRPAHGTTRSAPRHGGTRTRALLGRAARRALDVRR